MNSQTLYTAIIFAFLLVLLSSLSSALTISEVNAGVLYPGQSTQITLTIKNNLNDDAKDVSLVLILDKTTLTASGTQVTTSGTPFITIGSSETSIDKIKQDNNEDFQFIIKASNDIRPGIYNIPYVITYKINSQEQQKQGTFGLTVSAKTELSFSAETENNIQKQKGRVSLKIINNGLADIKFVSVKLSPSGFTLLSSNEVYVGTVNSDDFETSTFDVLFSTTSTSSKLISKVSYKDFDNIDRTQNIEIPIKIYTREKALELGLIKQSNTWIYALVVIVLIALWIIYRKIKKRRRLKNLNSK